MNIFHTLIVKISSVVAAIVLFLGPQAPTTPSVSVVEVQDSVATSEVVQPVKATVTPQTETSYISTEVANTPVTPIVPIYIINPQPTVEPVASTITSNTPMTQVAKIEIKNPIPAKGLGRPLKWRSEPFDDSSKIFIGAVLYNPDGSINDTDTVEITTDDIDQKRELIGTGDMSTFGDPNNPKKFYGFNYIIKTPGLHKITFTAKELGVSESVSINVTEEDTR